MAVLALAAAACAEPDVGSGLRGPVQLVVLHTADTHSQLFPFRMLVGAADERRGLGEAGTVVEVGGFARLATLLQRERRAAERSLHLDAGDLFQGSLLFQRYRGEPELRALAALGVDAQALGNHELDHGLLPLLETYGEFPGIALLAVNYGAEGDGGLGGLIAPFTIREAAGLRVGIIGVGNVRSVGLLNARPSELGVHARDAAQSVQGAIDRLRPAVDVLLAITHLGLDGDRDLVERTSGLDVVLGGHQHLALDEPLWVTDCGGSGDATIVDAWGRERRCTKRLVPVVHSGAYGRTLGRLRLELDDEPARLPASYDPLDAHEVTALGFDALPVHAGVAEEPALAALLEPYRPAGADVIRAAGLVAYAPNSLQRAGATGGDSPLGNFVAGAVRALAQTELALVGSSSLRHDLPAGVVDEAALVRVLPFDDPVVRLRVTGAALRAALEGAASTAAARGCETPVHVAGLSVRFRCPCAERPCVLAALEAGDALVPERSYSVATTEYLARGGSEFFGAIDARDVWPVADTLARAVADVHRHAEPCAPPAAADCEGCAAAVFERWEEHRKAVGFGGALDESATCGAARETCEWLACWDERAGAVRDGRIRFEAP